MKFNKFYFYGTVVAFFTGTFIAVGDSTAVVFGVVSTATLFYVGFKEDRK